MSIPEIRHYQRAALLTAADERRLAQRIEAGRAAQGRDRDGDPTPEDAALIADGLAAKQAFVEANVRLVLSLSRTFRTPNHVDRNDVIQDGILGLEKAVDRFDWRKGYKFSTYATWWVRQAMQRGLENTASTIRIPAHRSTELRVALATLDTSVSQLPSHLQNIAAASSIDSIDRQTTPSEDGDQTVSDLISSTDDGPDLMTEQSIDIAAARALLDQLDETSRSIVELRFGFGDLPPQTYAAIAKQHDMSHESVRRRVISALGRLRPAAEALTAA